MQYQIFSFNYKNSDLLIREELSFDEANAIKFMQTTKQIEKDLEIIILSTCNRVEIITHSPNITKSTDKILNLLSLYSNINKEILKKMSNIYTQEEAIYHIFCVTSSLDSLVIGETQIVGQIKDAYKLSSENNFCSKNLSRLIEYSLKVSANIRTKTQISKSPVSISSVAVDMLKDTLNENLGGFSVVVIGAGDVAKLLAKNLIKRKVNIIIVNRTKEKADRLANELGKLSRVIEYERLDEMINRYRIIFCATSAQHPIINQSQIEQRDFSRYWFDLSIPRNIGNIDDSTINLFRVDDLQTQVSKNLQTRSSHLNDAYLIAKQHTQEFKEWLNSLEIDPLIKDLRQKARNASLNEIKKSISKGYIPTQYEQELEKILHSAFNKFLHSPTTNLKNISKQQNSDLIIDSFQKIFSN